MNLNAQRRLLAEWEAQDAVLLAWPHPQTDWADQLEAAQQTFAAIIRAITPYERVILIVPERELTQQQLSAFGIDLKRVICYELPCDDTWARDFGPLAIITEQGIELQNLRFIGWGEKFDATLDNQLTQGLVALGAFGTTALHSIDLVFEGGSIETDGNGTLLTTQACLLEEHRNPQFTQSELEDKLKDLFGAQRMLWLNSGFLEGDDTDSHIDTLARFAPEDTIIFQGCDNPDDMHFGSFTEMHKELAAFTTSSGTPYRLLELPWPQPCYADNGDRLPATYANFLIINQAVLVPTYKDPADAKALEIMAKAFPQREIIPIDCRVLIQQHGSLHCVTMQLPKGVLA